MDLDSSIFIACISAGSAIAGSLISQIFSAAKSHLDRKHQRNILLREKYEELATQVSENLSWVTETTSATSVTDVTAHPHPALRAATLSHIYFPELRSHCESYVNSCIDYLNAIIDCQPGDPGMELEAWAIHIDDQEYWRSLSSMKEQRQDLLNAIIEFAPKYTRA